MVYGLPEGEIMDSQFDIAFACGSGHQDSDLQRNDLVLCQTLLHTYT